MSPNAGKIWFRVAVLIVLVSAGLLFFQKSGTAGYVITVTSLMVGLAFMVATAYAARRK